MVEPFTEVHNAYPEFTQQARPEEADYWAKVEDSLRPAQPQDGVQILGLESHGHRAVAQALTQRGVHESGGEDSGTPLERYVRYFVPGSEPVPWCAYFVSWCFDTTGDQNHRMPWSIPGYVGSIHSWAANTGRLVSTPEHGDIFGIGGEHTGLVVGANPATHLIWTIEGNYGDAVVQRNIDYRSHPLWFARM